MTWQEFMKLYSPNFSPLLPPGANPARIVGHQFTEDRIRLPGMYSLPKGPTQSGTDVGVFDSKWLGGITLRPENSQQKTVHIL